MNSNEAKKLNLPDILSRLGHQPVQIKKGGQEYWYNSPFRAEKDASFHTSYLGGKWIWKDFADEGGTVIDFIMRYKNIPNVAQALSVLDEMFQGQLTQSSLSFQQQHSAQAETELEITSQKELKFLSATQIKNPLILNYLTKVRGIDRKIALKHLQEVRYKNLNNGKEYFAFGIQNESGGYEIRVASDKYPFKSALIKKDVSLIKGSKPEGRVAIFEGTTDFLSHLTLGKSQIISDDAILMHSLSLYDRTLELISQNNYQHILTYLDNDKKGKEFTKKFQADLAKTDIPITVTPQNHLYEGHKDVNEKLKAQIKAASQNSFLR